MLDLVGIVFSSVMIFLVIFRAVQLDRTLPWFNPPKTDTDSSGLRLRAEAPTVAPTPKQPGWRE